MSRASRRATSRSTARHWQGSSSGRSSPGMTRRFESLIRTSSCRRSQLPGCTNYLSKMSADWRSKVGSITAVDWHGGTGARGNEGVAAMVARIKGAIRYVEYTYAKQNQLSTAKLTNKDGKAVAPTVESFTAAARSADWEAAPGFGVILTNESGPDSWPMTSATFVLVHKQPSDPAAAAEVLRFFNWAYAKGGKLAEELDYVPCRPTSSA